MPLAQYWIRRFVEIALKFKIYRIYTYIWSAHWIGNHFMHIFHASSKYQEIVCSHCSLPRRFNFWVGHFNSTAALKFVEKLFVAKQNKKKIMGYFMSACGQSISTVISSGMLAYENKCFKIAVGFFHIIFFFIPVFAFVLLLFLLQIATLCY